MPILYECSKCKEKLPRGEFHEFQRDIDRPVTSRCRSCRKEARYEKLYPNTICACCNKHRELDQNNICSDCNADSGLRTCKACNQVLPMYLCFTQKRRICKECLKKAKSAI